MDDLKVKDPSHSYHLKEEFVSMRKDGELFDYVIKGHDESFPIHSLVLASMSGMFKVMLKSNMAESAKREAEFPTILDGIMRKIIDFAYTGKCTFSRDELQPLIKAAHFLQMPKLQRFCEEKILKVLQPSNCLSWLRCTELEIMAPHVQEIVFTAHKEVIQTDEFQGAEMTEITQYLSSLSKKGVDSDTLVAAVLRWIKHDSPNRSAHMSELFACVSLGKCTKPFLSKVVKENSELLATQHNVQKLMPIENLCEDIIQPSEKLLVLGGHLVSCEPNNECWILEDDEPVKFAEGPGDQLRYSHSMCQVPQGVMLTGGHSSNMCKLFDVTNKTWLDRANLLSHRSRHGSGYLSGKVYVIGGVVEEEGDGDFEGSDGDFEGSYGDFEGSYTVDYMDLNTNTWQHGPNIPRTELLPKVAVCNSMLYVLLTSSRRLYCLDGATMAWTKRSRFPTTSRGCSMAAVDDKLFAAGSEIRMTYMYTPTSDTWCCLTGPSMGKGLGSLVYYRQKLLLIGDSCWDQRPRDVQEYDISSDVWFLTAWKLPTPLLGHGTFVFDSLK